MKIILTNGVVFPDGRLGSKIHPRYKGRVKSLSVDRSEIIFFRAKGGVFPEYARYIRELFFQNKTQEIFINEEK